METHQLTLDVGINQIVSLFQQLDKTEKFKIFEHFETDIFEFISLENKISKITDTQKNELKNRIKLIESGEMKIYNWDEIKSKYAI
jgi:hypothetical protein